MSSGNVYANLESIEDSLDGELILTFKRKSRQIVILNDSGSADLQYKFNESEDYATLKPTETEAIEIWAKTLYLKTVASVNYRVRVFG